MTTGNCLCGAVAFTLTVPVEYAGCCHCSKCQAATGSAFSPFAAVPKEGLRIDRGAEDLSVYARTADNVGHFCRHCGSLIYSLVRDGAYAHVQLGTIEGDPGIRPQFHVFVASKAPWYEIGDELPRYEGLPP